MSPVEGRGTRFRGRQWIELSGLLVGSPRHLSQHTGGMVMTRGPFVRTGADRKRGHASENGGDPTG